MKMYYIVHEYVHEHVQLLYSYIYEHGHENEHKNNCLIVPNLDFDQINRLKIKDLNVWSLDRFGIQKENLYFC